jgi:YD repeat-containing protein
VHWFGNAPEAPEPWTSVPGALSICEDTRHDQVETWVERTATCAELRGGTGSQFSLRAMVCGGPCPPPFFPACGAFCGRWRDVDGLTFAPPPADLNEHCPKMDCPDCEEGLSAGGATPAGGGACLVAPGGGPGATLRYSSGGVGAPGTPGAALWSAALGRYWSHDYAQRLVAGADPRQVWLITEEAVYRGFWDMDEDGAYEITQPADEYRRLSRSASGGWELVDLDGTVEAFDGAGRWLERRDSHGNRKLGVYSGGELVRVEMPDGRREEFTYHPGGKLETIREVGVGGAESRVWSYTWSGDDLVRIDRPDGRAWSLRYEAPGLPGYLTRQVLVGTDGGERIEGAWSYDAFGNVVETWRGSADAGTGVEVYAFSFDRPRNPTETTVTDPLGNPSTYVLRRDPESNKAVLLSTTGECPTCGTGPNTQLSYEDPANPLLRTREVDGRGKVTLYSYDGNGRMLTRTEAFGTPLQRETRWEYAGPFPALPTAIEQPSTAGPGERRTVFVYDASGTLVSRTIEGVESGSAFSLTTTTTSNAAGQPETIDPPGHGTQDQTSFTYDPARGDLIASSRTDPLVGTTGFAYDAFNRRLSVTDPNGVATETAYDPLGRVTAVVQKGATPAEDLITSHVYTPLGDLLRTVLPRGNTVEYGYDAAGRLVRIERRPDAVTPGERTVYTLDAAGNRTREDLQRWDGSQWVTDSFTGYEYSSRCHLDKVLHADGSVTEHAYDCNGNLERTWDANHPSSNQAAPPTMRYVYDELDRMVVTGQLWGGPGGGEVLTRYAYDIQDHLVEVVDGEGNRTAYEYSDRDLLTRQLSEVSGETRYRYEEHGELVEETDARGVTVQRLLDAADRVTLVDYPESALDTVYSYGTDPTRFERGRLVGITRHGRTIVYAYDRFGRVLRDGSLVYAYDANGNRTRVEYPGGVRAFYTHDFSDRELSLSLQDGAGAPQPIASDGRYLASGPLTSLTLGNGLQETRLFDPRYHPIRILVPGRLDWQYTTDDVGNILAITDGLNPSGSRSFGYQDGQYFLTRGDGPWGNLTWTYDRIGNRLSETRDGVTATYGYLANTSGGRNPKLLTVAPPLPTAPDRYFYDAAGNQTYKATDTEKLRLDYDAERRLSQLLFDTPEHAPSRAQMRYDGRSFLEHAESFFPLDAVAPQFAVDATYSSEGVLRHRTSVSAPSAGKTRREGTVTSASAVLYFAGRPVGLFDKQTTTPPGGPPAESSRFLYLSSDHLGGPALATDSVGLALWSGGFEPFGGDYAGARAAELFLTFPGQWADASWDNQQLDSRLLQNVHRWLASGIGAYTRPDPDPLVDPGAQLIYAYARQNPTGLIDSLGLRITHVDGSLEQMFNCAIQFGPPQFRHALIWTVKQPTDWKIRELGSAVGSGTTEGRRRLPATAPCFGHAVDRGSGTILVDTRDPSCQCVIEGIVREITELYANQQLGMTPDTIVGPGGASDFADPIVRQTRDRACQQCECKSGLR